MYSLSEAPRNGAEIMENVERMSMGAWRPSPGSIYPLLAATGLIGGIVTGLLHEVLHVSTHHYRWHWWKKHEW